jgi:hypothetical protein
MVKQKSMQTQLTIDQLAKPVENAKEPKHANAQINPQ